MDAPICTFFIVHKSKQSWASSYFWRLIYCWDRPAFHLQTALLLLIRFISEQFSSNSWLRAHKVCTRCTQIHSLISRQTGRNRRANNWISWSIRFARVMHIDANNSRNAVARRSQLESLSLSLCVAFEWRTLFITSLIANRNWWALKTKGRVGDSYSSASSSSLRNRV